jgi:hypothetical protein
MIYIDSEFKCHVADDGTRKTVETDFFDGKCDLFVEGYLFVPLDENWTRDDGEVFEGEMVTPWKDYAELEDAQVRYEREKLADAENALAILFGGETV